MASPHSDAFFMRAYDRECTETFWDGHVRAFAFLGGVRRRITHDNSRAMVAKIIGPRQRELTRGFLRLESLYLFDQHSGRVERPNEKGLVEGTVKFARLNFLVPIAQVRDLDELNAYLLGCCGEDPDRRLRGHSATRRVLPEEERDALLPPPAGPFDACRKESTTAGARIPGAVRRQRLLGAGALRQPPGRRAGLLPPRGLEGDHLLAGRPSAPAARRGGVDRRDRLSGVAGPGRCIVSQSRPTVLPEHYLKRLKLPAIAPDSPMGPPPARRTGPTTRSEPPSPTRWAASNDE